MNLKSITSGITATALVASIGIAYGQNTQSPPPVSPQPNAGTTAQSPGTPTPDAAANPSSSQTAPQPQTGTMAQPMDSTPSSTTTTPSDSSSTVLTERAPRADRN